MDERLRAGTRDYACSGRAVTLRRGGLEPRQRAAFGQSRPCFWPKIGQGIGVRIDARREIDPGFGRSRRELTGDFKRAAVIGERSVIRGPNTIPPSCRSRFRCRSRSPPLSWRRRSAIRRLSISRLAIPSLGWVAGWPGWRRASIAPSASFAARRAAGVLALCLYLAPVALVAWAATRLCLFGGALGFVVLAFLAASLPAQRSLAGHVKAVAEGLDASLEEGRRAVSKIVGRNPDVLDEAGVARAAIESLAENFSDGVVAPILWTALGGLVVGALYKAINTADSMIGHRDERYKAFGWAAARLDDLVNLPASRLAALWLILAAAVTPGALGARCGAGRLARRSASPLPQRRLARSGDGRRAWPQACRAAGLWRDPGRRRLHGERPTRSRRRRHPPGVAAL